jgi:hypothetical protein
MRFGIGLSVQHLPDDPQAARFAEHVERCGWPARSAFSSSPRSTSSRVAG